MKFVAEKDFEHLHHLVRDAFFEMRVLLNDKLKKYQIDAFFLSDSDRRGRGSIRAYVESFDFERFSPKDCQTGGKYVSFCDIFLVCIFLSCK